MATVWLDAEAKELLTKVRDEIRKEGVNNPSYGDAVRRLVRDRKK